MNVNMQVMMEQEETMQCNNNCNTVYKTRGSTSEPLFRHMQMSC